MNDAGHEMQRQALDSWQVIRNRVGLISLAFFLVFATAAIITYIMPRKYRGRVEMKIERMTNKVQVFSRGADEIMAPSDVVIKNEFERFKNSMSSLWNHAVTYQVMLRSCL